MELPEGIVVCIDNSKWMQPDSWKYKAQCEVIKVYCKAKLAAHPKNVVALYTMSSSNSFLFLDPPTRSIEKIIAHIPRIQPGFGDLDLLRALHNGRIPIAKWTDRPDRKLRMLFIIGGLTNLSMPYVERLGAEYIDMGIAVDVVNFYQGKIPDYRSLGIKYRFGRSELDAFVKLCNGNDNSHFVEVERGSDISDVLFKSILKDIPPQAAAAAAAAAADDEAQGSEHGTRDSLSKWDLYKKNPNYVDAEDLRIYNAPPPSVEP